VLADDFQCAESGLISNIHFWVSFKGGTPPSPPQQVHLSIYSDMPAGPLGHSRPDALLWARDLPAGQFVFNHYGDGLQGWFDPSTQIAIPEDHSAYFQINCTDLPDPYLQAEGTIYWLAVRLT
jgi:hypothetical protein